ncbi:Uncharacterised protein [Salmonella enterica subsp. enterica serovar Typhi]|nr:Uncharacterised protein [Salmonella enterica subsp. enterica serovar Typhi]CHM78589.1 Uncharacterised protein [Salmonella enterica subsp. enterica serovar Typhi]
MGKQIPNHNGRASRERFKAQYVDDADFFRGYFATDLGVLFFLAFCLFAQIEHQRAGFHLFGHAADKHVQLALFKTEDLDVAQHQGFQLLLQFDGVVVNTGQAVVFQTLRLHFFFAQIVADDDRHTLQTSQKSRLATTVASNDDVMLVDRDRLVKTALFDGGRQVADLLFVMFFGVHLIRDEFCRVSIDDFKVFGHYIRSL